MNKQTAKLIARIAENLPSLDSTTMQGWIDRPKALQRALHEALAPATDILRFTVDHGKSLEEMIVAGHFDSVTTAITPSRFSISGKGKMKVEAMLFHFNRQSVHSSDVVRELKKAGYRAANIAELLAFGTTFPNIQFQFRVIALGSSGMIPGGSVVPVLRGVDGARILDLSNQYSIWNSSSRFLAIRERIR